MSLQETALDTVQSLSLADLTEALHSSAKAEALRERFGLTDEDLLIQAEKMSKELAGSIMSVNMV